jgi:hypothetical protein
VTDRQTDREKKANSRRFPSTEKVASPNTLDLDTMRNEHFAHFFLVGKSQPS